MLTALNRAYALSLSRQKRRRGETLKSKFATLIGTPQTLGGGLAPVASAALALPANARLAASSDVPVAAGAVVVNVAGGRVLGTPALVADQIYEVGYLEAGKTVTLEKTTAGAGTITLYYLDEWKRPYPIASATFT